jgi:hypothetical protein
MCPYIVVVVVDDAAEFVAIDGRFRYHAASCYRAELLKIESCNTFALSMLSSWHEVTSTQDEVTEQCLLRRAAQKLRHTLAWQMFAITWILTSSSCVGLTRLPYRLSRLSLPSISLFSERVDY